MNYMKSGLQVLVLGLLLLTGVGDTARAEDAEEARTPVPVRTYDLRVVRVHAPAAALEAASFEDEGAVIRREWPVLLAVLQERGKVDLLVDQRITVESGGTGRLSVTTTIPIERFDQRNDTESRWRFDRIDVGVDAELRWSPAFTYTINAKWLHWYPKEGAVPISSTRWQGGLGQEASRQARWLRPGQTLALVSRHHIHNERGESEIAEIHAFVTRRVDVR